MKAFGNPRGHLNYTGKHNNAGSRVKGQLLFCVASSSTLVTNLPETPYNNT